MLFVTSYDKDIRTYSNHYQQDRENSFVIAVLPCVFDKENISCIRTIGKWYSTIINMLCYKANYYTRTISIATDLSNNIKFPRL